MVLWPKSSCTVRMSTPAMTRRLAKVCRKQCQTFNQKGRQHPPSASFDSLVRT
jgi:hypothetical protein